MPPNSPEPSQFSLLKDHRRAEMPPGENEEEKVWKSLMNCSRRKWKERGRSNAAIVLNPVHVVVIPSQRFLPFSSLSFFCKKGGYSCIGRSLKAAEEIKGAKVFVACSEAINAPV